MLGGEFLCLGEASTHRKTSKCMESGVLGPTRVGKVVEKCDEEKG